jgi:zinc/manganese transport system substrate-binding protein
VRTRSRARAAWQRGAWALRGGAIRLGAVALLVIVPGWVSAQVVFACGPEWAALARVLLPQATVHSATTARQDPHHIEARPALIAQMRSAELAVCTGAALESGWLPLLQQRSGNPRVQDRAPGMFWASEAVALIDPQPTTPGPFAGDVHAEGNPHIHTDPHRMLEVAAALAAHWQGLLPAQAAAIGQRHQTWARAFGLRIADWEQRTRHLKGRSVAAQHANFGYLWRWLGVSVVADLEPVPGMAPTPGHLQRLVQALRQQPVGAIVVGQHHDARAARWLAAQLGTAAPPVLVLPATVPDAAQPQAIEAWFEQLVQALVQAMPISAAK